MVTGNIWKSHLNSKHTNAPEIILHSENCLTNRAHDSLYWSIKPSNWRSSNSVTYSHCHRFEIPSWSWWLFEIELPLLFCYLQSFVSYPQMFVFGLVFDMFCLFSVNVGVECTNQWQIYIYHTESIWFSANVHSYHHNSVEDFFFVLVVCSCCCVIHKSARTYTQIPKYQ